MELSESSWSTPAIRSVALNPGETTRGQPNPGRVQAAALSHGQQFGLLVGTMYALPGVRTEGKSAVSVEVLGSDVLIGRLRAEPGELAQVAPTGGPRELTPTLGRCLPLPPPRHDRLPVGVDRVGEELHRGSATSAPAFLAVRVSDLVGDLGEVVGEVAVAELHPAQVPAVLLGSVEPLALQRRAPAGEHAGTDGAGDQLGGDLLAETEQGVDVDVPAVVAVGDLDDPGPPE